jgi:hypothetical protein
MQTITPTNDLSTLVGSDPNVDRIYDNVLSVVPSVTPSMVRVQLWNAIEEFYLKSTVKRAEVYWTMGNGVSVVDFNPYSQDWLVAWILGYTGLSSCGRIEPPAMLRDITCPAPTTTRQGQALLALKPISLDVDLPPDLWMQWFEAILDGTYYRLYMQPLKPFTSPQLAQYHASRFRSGIRSARAFVDKQYTNGSGYWCFPYFAHGRRKN